MPDPEVIWHGENNWELAKDYTLNGTTVPQGFRFDGASIPRPLWWWNQPAGIAFPAATIHDWLYKSHAIAREESDLIFYTDLISTGVRPSVAYLMWFAARLFGGENWKRNMRNAWKVRQMLDRRFA